MTAMKYGFIIAFLVLSIIQWIVPGKIIWHKNQVLKKGQSFKFRTEPVDPSSPFKGKYISLDFAESSFTDTIYRDLNYNDNIYLLLGTDRQGFASIRALSKDEPRNDNDYVKATVYNTAVEKNGTRVYVNYPFDKFYMDEYKAPAAEIIYRDSNRDTSNKTYALVKVLHGEGVIENVFINDVPIRSLIK
jgi:uncharacterized membrane-anchored protein